MAIKHTLVLHEPPGVLRALVPRLSGDGYLLRPLAGSEPWIDVLEDAVGGDVTGTEGHVEAEIYGDTSEVLARFGEALEQVWGFPLRMVDRSEFYERHPLMTDPELSPTP